MPGVDWIPGISQLKSTVQLLTGDAKGAAQTQANFFQECPGVSQAVSVGQLIAGDPDGALETQKKCLGTINNVANGLPVVGHVKGVIHHAVGDHEGGNQALNAATRSTVVLASGAIAGVATGGLGAIPAGIAAGSVYDITDTIVSDKPKGFIAAVGNVIDNPSGGTVFDAAAVIVGDGLAGHAGGQIGKSVANQIKLDKLETARNVKMDQLDKGMFPDKGSQGMSSGQATQLGQQINALTSEINTIRHGTPQYWYDAKSNQVVVKTPGGGGGSGGGLVAGSSSSSRQVQTGCSGFPAISSSDDEEEETGLKADRYSDEYISSNLTPDQIEKRRREHASQKPDKNKKLNYFRGKSVDPITKKADDLKRQNNDPQRNWSRNRVEALSTRTWLHVPMPSEFGYTAAIKTNHAFQGLEHSFVRHWDQWLERIPRLQSVLNRLEPIRSYLEKIRRARGEAATGIEINALLGFLYSMDNATFVEIQSALFDAQFALYDFIRANVTSSQYEGEGVNDNYRVGVYFRMPNRQVMVVGMSNELYPSVSEFAPDNRPVRAIITVFFMSEKEFKKSKKRAETKSWKKK